MRLRETQDLARTRSSLFVQASTLVRFAMMAAAKPSRGAPDIQIPGHGLIFSRLDQGVVLGSLGLRTLVAQL
jgi:hypothetical protein